MSIRFALPIFLRRRVIPHDDDITAPHGSGRNAPRLPVSPETIGRGKRTLANLWLENRPTISGEGAAPGEVAILLVGVRAVLLHIRVSPLEPLAAANIDVDPISAVSSVETWLRDVELPLAFSAESRVERRLRDRVREWLRSSRAVIARAKINLTREEFALDMTEAISGLLNLRFKV
jgi:hypothetical protein